MKIAIVGSRGFKPLSMVTEFVQTLEQGTVVVTGGARGVDKAAETAATAAGLTVIVFKPDWMKHGKGAGMRRNTDIVKECNRLVAFWDGSSRGTFDSMKKAKAAKKPVKVFTQHWQAET